MAALSWARARGRTRAALFGDFSAPLKAPLAPARVAKHDKSRQTAQMPLKKVAKPAALGSEGALPTGQCGCSCSRIKHATQGQSKQAPPGTAASSDAVPRFDPVCDRERCGRARLKPHTNPNRTQKRETAEFSLRHREPVNRAPSRTQQASARTHDANFLKGGTPARIPERLNPRQTAMPYGAPPGV